MRFVRAPSPARKFPGGVRMVAPRWRALCALVVLSCALLYPVGASRAQTPTGLSPVDAEASSDDPGIPIPGGWFYGAAASDLEPDLGFAGYDGHGAALWTAYQAQGGPDELGLPVSRRFELDEDQAQLFEHGVLRWDAD